MSSALGAVGPYGGPRVGLVTLGCDKNTVDSERMMAALVGHGARVSSDLDGVDVVIVNNYKRKKDAYLKSAIKITNSLPKDYKEFRFAQVDKRSATLADRAVKLWPVP